MNDAHGLEKEKKKKIALSKGQFESDPVHHAISASEKDKKKSGEHTRDGGEDFFSRKCS